MGERSSCVGRRNFSSILVPSLAEILWPLLDLRRPDGLPLSKLEPITVALNGVLVEELPWDRIVAEIGISWRCERCLKTIFYQFCMMKNKRKC